MNRLIFALFCAVAVVAAHADDITLESAPPVIVKSTILAGSDNVDPATNEIRVTFSKDMTTNSYSVSTHSPESAPEFSGKPRYLDDKRTCVISVKLQPGKTYALWLNSNKFRNFKDTNGQPALPYLLVFRTKG